MVYFILILNMKLVIFNRDGMNVDSFYFVEGKLLKIVSW